MKKVIAIGIVFVLLSLIGGCLYFVAGVSETFPPIATYDYQGNVNQLVKQLQKLSEQKKGLTFKLTDTTGDSKSGHAYYFTLNWITKSAGTIQYGIKLSRTNNHFTENKTVIDVVKAINLTRSTGGYSQTAVGVHPLVTIFDREVLTGLITDKH